MDHSHSFTWILVSLLSLALAAPLQAGIIPSGDVDPTEYSWWHNGGNSLKYAYIGKATAGSVTVNLGSDLSSKSGYIGHYAGSTGVVTVDDSGSTWTNISLVNVGFGGHGTLNITNGGVVSDAGGHIGFSSGSTGAVTVDGIGSAWTNSTFYAGRDGQCTLNITNGGTVISYLSSIVGYGSGSTSMVTVDGIGSTWANGTSIGNYFYVGYYGQGTLSITNGGLVSVAATLTIDYDGDGDYFINMASGGMLALYGNADDSLTDFFGLIKGTNAIRYWNGSSWVDITGATYSTDYTLSYLTEGDLAGYTVLTVTAIPEPASVVLLLSGGVLAMFRRRRK